MDYIRPPTKKHRRVPVLCESSHGSGLGEETQHPRLGNRLCPAIDCQFAVDVCRMPFDGAEGDDQSPGNLTVRQALGE